MLKGSLCSSCDDLMSFRAQIFVQCLVTGRGRDTIVIRDNVAKSFLSFLCIQTTITCEIMIGLC